VLSPGPLVSSTNKTDRHNITEINKQNIYQLNINLHKNTLCSQKSGISRTFTWFCIEIYNKSKFNKFYLIFDFQAEIVTSCETKGLE
jgi:hypothetical protein